VRVAAIQHDIVWEDPARNFAALTPQIAAAKAGGADLVVLSEMFSTGFSMDVGRVGEAEGGPSAQFIHEQATAHGIWLCGSIPERRPDAPDARPANTLVLVGPTGQTHRYRKIHPFSYGGEHEHYEAGSDYLTVAINGVRTSFFICYDLRFADEFWALAPTTDLYVIPANWPEARRVHWQALLQSRAIENQAFVVGCNRVGEGGGLAYSGDSRIIDPLGELLTTAARQPTTIFADVDAATVAQVRTRFPFLTDRR
jgi:predicted amidohydrolase